MLLGTGKADITPPRGTPLAGYGFRDHGAEAIRDNLEVRAIWLQSALSSSDAVCIVTADLIGFGALMTERIRSEVKLRFCLASDRFLLSASHTHSGPQTQECMVATGEIVPSVLSEIEESIYDAIETAREDLREVTMHLGIGECSGFAINRRMMKNGIFLNAPNPDGIRDDAVTVISFQDAEDKSVRAVLFHFTCHPTTMGDYSISSDYPGAARRVVEAGLGGEAIAAFLPGCFGDVRPNCAVIGGKSFRRGIDADLRAFGNALGGEVLRLLKSELKSVQPTLFGKAVEIELDMQSHPSKETLTELMDSGSVVEKQWAAKLLASPLTNKRKLTLQRLDLSSEIILIAMGGEICCEFGQHIRKMQTDSCLLPLGYSNGLLGYICPESMYAEGGYEPIESTIYFGLPSAFQPNSEQRVLAAVAGILEENS